MREYHISLTKIEDVSNVDCVIVAVAHSEFKTMSINDIKKLFRHGEDSKKILVDVKGVFKIDDLVRSGMTWWRL